MNNSGNEMHFETIFQAPSNAKFRLKCDLTFENFKV